MHIYIAVVGIDIDSDKTCVEKLQSTLMCTWIKIYSIYLLSYTSFCFSLNEAFG